MDVPTVAERNISSRDLFLVLSGLDYLDATRGDEAHVD